MILQKALSFTTFTVLLLITNLMVANKTITMLMSPYPYQCDVKTAAAKLTSPRKMAKHTFRTLCKQPSTSGIISTYGGFFNISDNNGITIFPRNHSRPFVHVIVTPEISPIIMHSNTLSHWEIDSNDPYAVYLFEQKVDTDTGLTFWQVSTGQLLIDYIIPLESIIILANPKHIFIPIGITITTPNANLILPEIYVKAGINTVKSTFHWLYSNQFFGSLKQKISAKDLSYRKIVDH